MNKTVTLCFIDFQILHLNQLSFNVQNSLHKWNSCSCTNHFNQRVTIKRSLNERKQVKFYRFNIDRWIRLISINRFVSIYRMIFRYQFLSNDNAGQYFKRIGLKTLNWLLLKINLLCTLNLNGFQCFIQHFAWSQTNVWSFEGLWTVLCMTNYT